MHGHWLCGRRLWVECTARHRRRRENENPNGYWFIIRYYLPSVFGDDVFTYEKLPSKLTVIIVWITGGVQSTNPAASLN